jgi:hypothetical protein
MLIKLLRMESDLLNHDSLKTCHVLLGSAGEQEKTRSQPVSVTVRGKLLVNRADSQKSAARFVGRFCCARLIA